MCEKYFIGQWPLGISCLYLFKKFKVSWDISNQWNTFFDQDYSIILNDTQDKYLFFIFTETNQNWFFNFTHRWCHCKLEFVLWLRTAKDYFVTLHSSEIVKDPVSWSWSKQQSQLSGTKTLAVVTLGFSIQIQFSQNVKPKLF